MRHSIWFLVVAILSLAQVRSTDVVSPHSSVVGLRGNEETALRWDLDLALGGS